MIEIKNINKYFNKGKKNEIHVIDNTTLSLPDNGLVALLGPSGCGKTTLLNTIGGLDRIKTGSIYINNQKISSKCTRKVDKIRNLNVGYIFQDYKLIDNMSVFDNVAIALKTIGVKDKKEIKTRVEYVLEKLNMLRYKYRPSEMLSGGERQRVGIARALVKNPDVILADEPTGNLDSKNSLEIMNIIKAISRERLVILVTHEQDLAKFFASRIIEISDGKVIKDYDNIHNDQLDYRIDNTFYLKDFLNHQEIKGNNYSIDIYGDKNEKVKLDIVLKNGNIYIKNNFKEKVEVVDEDSSIEFVNSNYKKIAKDDVSSYNFDLDKIINKDINYKYSSIYNPITLIANGFRKLFGFSILKKILLLGFFISGMFIMYSFSSISAVLKVEDKDFVTYNPNYLVVSINNTKVKDFLNYEKMEEIKYIIPGNSMINLQVRNLDIYQTSQMVVNLSGSLTDITSINEKDLIMGHMPENENEIVVDKYAIEKMFQNSRDTVMIGILDYTYMLNRVVSVNNMKDLVITGIVDKESPSIYANSSLFINLIDNSENSYNGHIITTNKVGGWYSEETQMPEFLDYNLLSDKIKIVKGRLPKNDYEVIVNNDYNDLYKLNKTIDVKINNTKLKVVGYYTSKENINTFLVNNNTIKYNLIRTISDFMIYSVDKDKTIKKFHEEKMNIYDSYQKNKDDYIKSRKDYVKSSVIASSIILFISLIEIFLILRSSFLSRIREVGILRAIGIKKVDIYKMFFGEIFAITIIASVPGVVFMAYILNTLSSVSYLKGMFIVNPLIVIFSILVIFIFNTIVGLLPAFKVIIKSPARILARHDLD